MFSMLRRSFLILLVLANNPYRHWGHFHTRLFVRSSSGIMDHSSLSTKFYILVMFYSTLLCLVDFEFNTNLMGLHLVITESRIHRRIAQANYLAGFSKFQFQINWCVNHCPLSSITSAGITAVCAESVIRWDQLGWGVCSRAGDVEQRTHGYGGRVG